MQGFLRRRLNLFLPLALACCGLSCARRAAVDASRGPQAIERTLLAGDLASGNPELVRRANQYMHKWAMDMSRWASQFTTLSLPDGEVTFEEWLAKWKGEGLKRLSFIRGLEPYQVLLLEKGYMYFLENDYSPMYPAQLFDEAIRARDSKSGWRPSPGVGPRLRP